MKTNQRPDSQKARPSNKAIKDNYRQLEQARMLPLLRSGFTASRLVPGRKQVESIPVNKSPQGERRARALRARQKGEWGRAYTAASKDDWQPFIALVRRDKLAFLQEPWSIFYADTLLAAAVHGNTRAKHLWKDLCKALTYIGPGRIKGLSAEEALQKKKQNDLQSQQDGRALKYSARQWDTYTEKTKGVTDTALLLQEAQYIARKEHARGGPAKREGIRLFLKQVEHSFPTEQERTVRKNSR